MNNPETEIPINNPLPPPPFPIPELDIPIINIQQHTLYPPRFYDVNGDLRLDVLLEFIGRPPADENPDNNPESTSN
tara:strand:+ start:760 stop:987 length:228 start_codon:yes stop_codon:yes gene_type:complete